MNQKIINIYNNPIEVSFSDIDKEKVINRILKFCEDNNCISGEKLHQDDDCIIYSPEVLSDIIDDILKFKEL